MGLARPPSARGLDLSRRTDSAPGLSARGDLGVGVSAKIVLRPGRMPLADWRAIHAGATVALDPYARVDVEAGRAALETILSQDDGRPRGPAAKSPSVAELVEARGALLPEGELRLFSALKLASLAQGVSGVRWEVIEALAVLLERNVLPAVQGGTSDRLALSHIFAMLTGTGEALDNGNVRPAAEILREADMRPLSLNPSERSALLSGTELTLATTIGALFSAEHVLQSALVAAALSALSADHSAAALHPSAHRLHRQRGQLDVATALRALAPPSTTEGESDSASDGANACASAVFRAGVALDLLRQAAVLLERAGNGVSEDRLVLWQSEEVVSGATDMTSLSLAADLIAMALGALSVLVATRIDAIAGPEADKAEALADAIKEQAGVPALDPAGIARLRPLVDATSKIVALELLRAVRHDAPSDEGLSDALRLVHYAAPDATDSDAFADEDIRAVAELVRSGALAAAVEVPLPSVVPMPAGRPQPR